MIQQNKIIELPDGTKVGTGLWQPEEGDAVTCFAPAYEDNGPMWTRDEIRTAIATTKPRRQVYTSEWVYNQGSLGSCNGWACSSALERARHARGLDRVRLSGTGVYAQINGGQDRGSMLDDGMKTLMEDGAPPFDMVSPREYRKRLMDPEAFVEGKRFRALECYGIRTEDALASALAAGFVCVIAVHAGNGGLSPDDGVIGWTNGPGNHSVCCDGVVWDGRQYKFDVANSWGTNWGEFGRCYVTWRQHLTGPIKNHYFFAIRGCIDDPKGINP